MEMFVNGILIEVVAAEVGESVGAAFFPLPASFGGVSSLFLFPGDAGVGAGAITGTKPAGMWWVEPGGMVSTLPCCCGDRALVVAAVVVCAGGIAVMGTGTGMDIVLL